MIRTSNDDQTPRWILLVLTVAAVVVLGGGLFWQAWGNSGFGDNDDAAETGLEEPSDESVMNPSDPINRSDDGSALDETYLSSDPDADVVFSDPAVPAEGTEVVDVRTGEKVDGIEMVTDGIHWFPLSSAGPKEFGNGRSIGFEQTDEGAALAAVHIFQRSSPLNVEGFKATNEEQLTSEVADIYAFSVEEAREAMDSGQLDETEFAQVTAPIGWTVETVVLGSTRDVNVFFDSHITDGTVLRLKIKFSMRWIDGDWKLRIPFPGSFEGMAIEVAANDLPDVDLRALVIRN